MVFVVIDKFFLLQTILFLQRRVIIADNFVVVAKCRNFFYVYCLVQLWATVLDIVISPLATKTDYTVRWKQAACMFPCSRVLHARNT